MDSTEETVSRVAAREVKDSHGKERRAMLSHAPIGRPSMRLTDPQTEALPPKEFVQGLVKAIRAQADADIGPFYKHLLAGKLSPEGLRTWVKQWYYDARAFPPLVAQVIANCDVHYDVRQCFGANLVEELGDFDPSREHPQLMKKIGAALGVSEEEMEFVEPLPELLVFVEFRHKLVRDGSFVEAVAAAALSTELTIPNRYRRIGAALQEHYGVPRDAMDFLWVHTGDIEQGGYGGDVRHSNEAVEVVMKYATTAAMQERVRLALWRSVEARKVYQWGLFRACVLEQDQEYKSRYLNPDWAKK